MDSLVLDNTWRSTTIFMSAKKKGLLSRNELLSCVFFPAFLQNFSSNQNKKKRKLTLSRIFYSKKDNPDFFFQPTQPNQKTRLFIPTKHPTPVFTTTREWLVGFPTTQPATNVVVVGVRGLGGDKTRIHWIGLWGVGSEHKRQAGGGVVGDGGMVVVVTGIPIWWRGNPESQKGWGSPKKDVLLVNFLGGDIWSWLSNMCVCFLVIFFALYHGKSLLSQQFFICFPTTRSANPS